MPRQNRVMPFGDLVATPERGTFFGNRGILHDDHGRIRRAWQVRRWLLCLLEFRDRWRPPVTPGHYTGLFFLDEATGLAAGHRPCFECRRSTFNAFRAAFMVGSSGATGRMPPTAADMDNRLHGERLGPGGTKRTFAATLGELPDGVLVTGEKLDAQAWLLWKDRLLAWSAGGYGERRPASKGLAVEVLTPASTVAAIRSGYVPDVHPSADSQRRGPALAPAQPAAEHTRLPAAPASGSGPHLLPALQ